MFGGRHRVKNAVTGKMVRVTNDGGNTTATFDLAAGTSAVLMTE
jgi:hypothetical protein